MQAIPRRRRSRGQLTRRYRLTLRLVSIAGITAGIAVVLIPLIGVWTRAHNDADALAQWQQGGSQNLVGAPPAGAAAGSGQAAAGAPCSATGAPADDYARVSFASLPYGYAGIAAEGNWDTLQKRSMVHYQGTPGPGGLGNMIIAFHREPEYQHVDELAPGGTIDVEDRSCHTYRYRVTQQWVLPPSRVTQLSETTGHDLTLITCTPWWRDYNRIVWRATLVPDPAPVRSTPGLRAA
jgi:LPXTG-site transpeptidase (sortase) family protein